MYVLYLLLIRSAATFSVVEIGYMSCRRCPQPRWMSFSFESSAAGLAVVNQGMSANVFIRLQDVVNCCAQSLTLLLMMVAIFSVSCT